MRDRLGDVLGGAGAPSRRTDVRPAAGYDDNPFESRTDLPPLARRPKGMDDFFRQVEAIQDAITDINSSSTSISEWNDRVAGSEEEQDTSLALDRVIRETNHRTNVVKAGLERLKEELATIRSSNTSKADLDDVIRTRENMSMTLTRSFMSSMRQYQLAQQAYQKSIKTKIRRQLQIVKPDATQEDVEVMLQAGGGQNIYKSAILQGSIDGAICTAYDNCRDKYQDVLKLESSVAEVHQMFQDLAIVVEQQGGMLDQIETSVQSASNYVEKGNEQLSKAIQHQSCARKKQCCLLFFGLLIIFVITIGIGM